MRIIKHPVSSEYFEATVIAPYAKRLIDYGYKPTSRIVAFLNEKNLKYNTRVITPFIYNGFIVTFLMSRLGYRFKIEYNGQLFCKTRIHLDPKELEAPFLSVFKDSFSVYAEKDEIKHKAKKHERTKKISAA